MLLLRITVTIWKTNIRRTDIQYLGLVTYTFKIYKHGQICMYSMKIILPLNQQLLLCNYMRRGLSVVHGVLSVHTSRTLPYQLTHWPPLGNLNESFDE